jgi:hypothetical protein
LSVVQFMRCFYHDDREAVGTCKSCGKGLCRECAVDLTKGLACRGHCEADAQAVIQLIDRNIQVSPDAARMVRRSRGLNSGVAIFYILLGGLSLAGGIRDERLSFFSILGVAMIIFGIYLLVSLWKRGNVA